VKIGVDSRRITERLSACGVSLIEFLVALVIFSIGLLGLAALQTNAITAARDSTYRIEAGFLAKQLIGRMWANKANLAAYVHRPTTDAGICNFSGANTANANATDWLKLVARLPGAASTRQQIIVAADNTVTVTVCWQPPNGASFHRLTASSRIN
jgi:type IV pilus assembly protein PilV